MFFKRSGKHIFGVDLTSKEEEALHVEARKIVAEESRNHEIDEIATVLYFVKKHFNLGPIRLKRYFDDWFPSYRKLTDHYETGITSSPWLCREMLEREGIDVQAWYDEFKK